MFNSIPKRIKHKVTALHTSVLFYINAYIDFLYCIDFRNSLLPFKALLSTLIEIFKPIYKLFLEFLYTKEKLNYFYSKTKGTKNQIRKVNKRIIKRYRFDFKVGETYKKEYSRNRCLKKGFAIPKGILNLIRVSRFSNKSKFPRVRQICIPIAILGMYINIVFINELYRSFCNISINWVFVFYTSIPFVLILVLLNYCFKNLKK